MTKYKSIELLLDSNPGEHFKIVSMEEILNAKSCDNPGNCDCEDYDCQLHYGPVYEILNDKREDHHYKFLKATIIANGFKINWAPEYHGGIVWQGHHRIAVLEDLGAKWCPVQEYEEPLWDLNYY